VCLFLKWGWRASRAGGDALATPWNGHGRFYEIQHSDVCCSIGLDYATELILASFVEKWKLLFYDVNLTLYQMDRNIPRLVI
jgi:hypothetical protein